MQSKLEFELVTLEELKLELEKEMQQAHWKTDGFAVRLKDAPCEAIRYHSEEILHAAAIIEVIKEIRHIVRSCEGTTPKVEESKTLDLILKTILKQTLKDSRPLSVSTSVLGNAYKSCVRATYVNMFAFITQKKSYTGLYSSYL